MDHKKDIYAPDYDLAISDFMSESRPDGIAQAGVLPGDYHVHTTFSDGTGSVAECIERAISVGLTEIGIADHVSAVQPSVWEIPSIPLAKLERYVAEVREAASRYDEITVLLGVEADYVPEHETQLRALLDGWPFDYVIGGVHGVDGFDFDDPARRRDPRWSDSDALFAAYYETVRRAAEFGGFDIIAHLDYIGLWGHTPGPAVGDSIDAALDAIAASGAAIELNTDRFSDPAGVMYPSDELLSAVGGRGTALVISSDAHAAEHVGQLWDEAMERAVRAGFCGALRLSDRTLVPLQRAVAGDHREAAVPDRASAEPPSLDGASPGRLAQLPAVDPAQHERIEDHGVAPAPAELGRLDRSHVEGGQHHQGDIEHDAKDRPAHKRLEDEQQRQDDDVVVERQAPIGRIVKQPENVEVTEPDDPSGEDHEGSRDIPGAEAPDAQKQQRGRYAEADDVDQ